MIEQTVQPQDHLMSHSHSGGFRASFYTTQTDWELYCAGQLKATQSTIDALADADASYFRVQVRFELEDGSLTKWQHLTHFNKEDVEVGSTVNWYSIIKAQPLIGLKIERAQYSFFVDNQVIEPFTGPFEETFRKTW